MVGVGGRSKACATCRRRRVKCDETKPKCRRCAKGDYECGGYLEMRFIQFEKKSSQPLDWNAPIISSDQNADRTLVLLHGLSARKKYHAHSMPSSICPIPSLTPFQDNICATYTMEHLLSGSDYDGKTPWMFHGWPSEPLANHCLHSLALAYFGSQHGEDRLLEKGFKQYGAALRELNKALANSSKCQTRELLVSVAVMALFEYFISEDPNGWIGHSLGLERLCELRGPASFQKDTERLIFERSRPTIIFAALVLRRRTILSSSEWKTIPWALEPEVKSAMQYLVDILADCPYVCMLKDQIISSAAKLPGSSSAEDIVNKFSVLLDELEAWKLRWGIEPGKGCFEVPAPPTSPLLQDSEGNTKPFWSTVLHYDSLSAANQNTLHNAIRILLLKAVEDLIPFTNGLKFNQGPVYPQMYTAGINICRNIDFHLLHYQAGSGSSTLLFPFRMAWQTLGRSDSVIGQWLEHLIHMIAYGTSAEDYRLGGKWAVARYILTDFANLKGARK